MKIAILDDYADVALTYGDWDGLGEVTVFRDTLPAGPDLVQRLLPFDALCIMRERTPIPAELIAALPRLRLIVTSGPRNGSIALDAAKAAGITVCGTESRKTTTSELTLLLMLALNRQLLPNAARLRAGGWQGALGRDLAGLRLGLVGLGKIGAQVATLANALGMEVCAWSQNLTEARAQACNARLMPGLAELCAASDIVSVHLVLSERTRNLISAEHFAAMKPGAVFVNTSRAAIVDQSALLDGLRKGAPTAAGLDVFDIEPLPAAHPLRDAELLDSGRLLLTPHLGYTTEATLRLFYAQMAEAVRAFQNGQPVRML